MKFSIKSLMRAFIVCAIMYPAIVFAETIKVGSKNFNEGYILSEVFAQLLEANGFAVERKFGLGGTLIAYESLKTGAIDVYPEYTGTIEQAILKVKGGQGLDELNSKLNGSGLSVLKPLGFNNTYALAVTQRAAETHNLINTSDLVGKDLRAAISHEYLKRGDGWDALKKAYQFDLKVQAVEHELAYVALENNNADLMDVYTTDAKIKTTNLIVLKDDKNFFPKYLAVPFVNNSTNPKVKDILNKLSNRIDEDKMILMNEGVQIHKKSFAQVAQEFLQSEGLAGKQTLQPGSFAWSLILKQTYEHLFLTLVALIGAILIAIPTAILLLKVKAVAGVVLGIAGLMQTIPSIALLAFMIPLFGIGVKPAIIGLMVYSLLPILRNTYVALDTVNEEYIESARGIGLSNWESLLFVRIPIGLPVILAGIRIAAVISIGTATLAAFIGAGGLGDSIVTGLSLNDSRLILQGAVPAALLAVLTELIFSWLQVRSEKSF